MPSLIHRGFALLLLCVAFASGLWAASGTITFDEEIAPGLFLVTDGQGGSDDIAGIELQIYVADAGGDQIDPDSTLTRFAYEAAPDTFSTPMLVWADYVYGMTIKSWQIQGSV